MTRIEEIKYQLTILENRDTLHTDRAAMADYDALRRELAVLTPAPVASDNATGERRRAIARHADYMESAKARALETIQDIRNCRRFTKEGTIRDIKLVGLYGRLHEQRNSFRQNMRVLRDLKAARETITFTADDIATEAGRQNVMAAIMGRAAENAGGVA